MGIYVIAIGLQLIAVRSVQPLVQAIQQLIEKKNPDIQV